MIALITARGGSKGLLRKNIYPLAGKPLINWSIDVAKACNLISDVYVTTDDEEIAQVAAKQGANIIKRPAELSTDTASSDVAIEHAIDIIEKDRMFENLILLQPTSPLRTVADICEAYNIYQARKANCVISGYIPPTHPAKSYQILDSGQITGLYSKEAPNTRRQDLPECFYPNGAIYLFSVKTFKAYNTIPKSNVYPYIMSLENSADIDNIVDLKYCEEILLKRVKDGTS